MKRLSLVPLILLGCAPAPLPRPVTFVDVQPDSVSIPEGTSFQFRVVTSGPVRWSVSDSSLASVDSTGRLHALRAGRVSVTATLW